MFSIKNYIMTMLKGMAGNYPDWQIMEYALNWYSRGKLSEDDLAVVENWFAPTPEPEEEPVEEPETEE